MRDECVCTKCITEGVHVLVMIKHILYRFLFRIVDSPFATKIKLVTIISSKLSKNLRI